jgi:hypothetical protein
MSLPANLYVRGKTAREERTARRHESGPSNADAGGTERYEQKKTFSRLKASPLAAPFFSSSPFAGNESRCELPAGARCAETRRSLIRRK